MKLKRYKEKKSKPDDCWVDDEWKKNNGNDLVSAIGFSVNKYDDYEDNDNKNSTPPFVR